MQLWCRLPRVLMSSPRSFLVTVRSPSSEALASPASALSFLAWSMSFLAFVSLSSRDCFSILKLWDRFSSVFLRSSSCASAFSRRPSSVSMMVPLFFLYASGSGAPRASSSELNSESSSSPSSSLPASLLCSRAVSFCVLSEDRELASTMAVRACARVAAFLICTRAAPPFISRSRMETARSSWSMVDMSSCSSLPKVFASAPRIRVAALRSASSVEMAEESSSIFVEAASMTLACFSMAACRSPTSALLILISLRISTERSSHHSANSSYVFWDEVPCARIFCCISLRSCKTLLTGLASPASSSPRATVDAQATRTKARSLVSACIALEAPSGGFGVRLQ
mmetsp:Transcript_53359/g.157144  ORF Transcript_53359/g.157144 Transcript_53359/m.157144 type:complete len:341 (+) Transcript_53359:1261-2283(+)